MAKLKADFGYLHWQEKARCAGADPSLFFPSEEESEVALQMCRECLVREECLEYALEHNIEFGIWGGMTEAERRTLRKKSA